MPLTEQEELELLRLRKRKSLALQSEPEKKSLLQKTGDLIVSGAKNTGQFFKDFKEEPLASTGGLLTGIGEGIGKTGAGLIPKPKENLNLQSLITGEPTKPKIRPTTNIGSLTSLDVRGGAFRPPKKTERKPFTPEAEAAFQRKRPVGEFAAKTGLGIAATTLIPGGKELGTLGKIGINLAKGAAANIPFAASALEEGGTEGLIRDVALNTAIDLATLGIAKAVPGIKSAIIKKFGKEVTEEVAEKLAKEAFEKVQKGAFDKSVDGVGKLDKIIDKGISKGVKPDFPGKKDFTKRVGFNKKSNDAVKVIAENKDLIKITNDVGEAIPYPKSAGDMASAIQQAKKIVFDQYYSLTKEAGQGGAKFNISNVNEQLEKWSKDLGNSPEVREYAKKIKGDLVELHGQSPQIIERRISDLNSSLAGFYDGRATKAKAQIDASIASVMRQDLDDIITNATGTQYSPIKAKYAALKTIEKDVNKRAVVNARRAKVGLIDMTDLFTGGDIAAGLLTANPALLTKGVAGKGIKEVFKALNDPDRAIAKMFKQAYGHVDKFNEGILKSQKKNLGTLKSL